MIGIRHQITILLLFITFSVSAQTSGKLYLIRHAVVDIEKPGICEADVAQEYKQAYNELPVVPFDKVPVLSKIENPDSVTRVYCSPLVRSQLTAAMLFGENVELIVEDELREFEFNVVKIPVIQLPLKGWLGMSRLLWMLNINKKGVDSFAEKKEQICKLEEHFKEILENGKDVVVVGHGFQQRTMIRYLKKHGWQVVDFEGYENLAVNCLTIQ